MFVPEAMQRSTIRRATLNYQPFFIFLLPFLFAIDMAIVRRALPRSVSNVRNRHAARWMCPVHIVIFSRRENRMFVPKVMMQHITIHFLFVPSFSIDMAIVRRAPPRSVPNVCHRRAVRWMSPVHIVVLGSADGRAKAEAC